MAELRCDLAKAEAVMNITVRFVESCLAEIALMREEYISGLRCAQELMLEVMLPQCRCYLVTWRRQDIGYLIVNPSHVLVEMHLVREHWLHGQSVVRQAIRALRLEQAVVKSFDDLFLSSAIEHQRSVSVMGLLVRDYVPRPLPYLPRLCYSTRQAASEDMPAIAAIEQDVFSDPERVALVVSKGWMQLFATQDGSKLIGFGILRPLHEASRYVDVGIAVDTPFRNKGYAVYMMRELVELCVTRGFEPVAGCSSDNLLSRRLGERIGLVARHRLLRLTF